MAREAQETDWTAVIARTLAFLCVQQAQLQDETLVKQADFLERFGIPRSEAAVVLGSSAASLQVMDSRQKGRAKKTTKKKTNSKRAAKKPSSSGR